MTPWLCAGTCVSAGLALVGPAGAVPVLVVVTGALLVAAGVRHALGSTTAGSEVLLWIAALVAAVELLGGYWVAMDADTEAQLRGVGVGLAVLGAALDLVLGRAGRAPSAGALDVPPLVVPGSPEDHTGWVTMRRRHPRTLGSTAPWRR